MSEIQVVSKTQVEVERKPRVYFTCHPDTLNCLNNLACSYYDFGDKKTALTLLRQAYARCCRALGKGHPTTVKIRKNLSKLQ